VTPSTTTSTTSTVARPPTALPTTTVAPTGAACQNNQIRVEALGYGAAAGSVAETLGFVNVSDRSCSLGGYPGVAGLDAEGNQVIQATRETTSMLGGLQNGSKILPVVSLAPGQTASADVAGNDNPVGTATSCPYYPSLLVTPPNLTQPTLVTKVGVQVPGATVRGFPGCSGLSVDPVVPGSTGRAS
jgi:hypothetical protein